MKSHLVYGLVLYHRSCYFFLTYLLVLHGYFLLHVSSCPRMLIVLVC